MAAFVVQRTPSPSGSFTDIATVVAGGPQLYHVVDTTITPVTPYRYRLKEVLTFGPPEFSKILAEVFVDGIPNAGKRKGDSPLNPYPIAGDPEGAGPVVHAGKLLEEDSVDGDASETAPGTVDIQGILDAAQADGTIDIVLAPGRQSSFSWEAPAPAHGMEEGDRQFRASVT